MRYSLWHRSPLYVALPMLLVAAMAAGIGRDGAPTDAVLSTRGDRPSSARAPSVQAARRATRPNILVAISDDQSWPHASIYGTSWVETPAFDRVARAGLLFQHAYTPNAKCGPSRAAILTGRNSWQLGPLANHWAYWPEEVVSYVEALERHGYFAGHTGKDWQPGRVAPRDGAPRYVAGVPFEAHRLDPPTAHISANDYAANFEAFLDARPDNAPFVFWYGALEPHRGFTYGSGVEQGGRQPADVRDVPPVWPESDTVRTDLLDYAYEIEHFDRHLGRMLELLEERGELANTLVVVTSDNGMAFPRVKGQGYAPSNHLPLAVMWPEGIAAPGRVVEDLVSFVDFAPTFLEVAGVAEDESGMQSVTGRSLTDVFLSEEAGRVAAERDHVLIGKERHDVGRPRDGGYPIRGIVTRDYLYLHNFETDRWPAGPPETGYLNTDGGPTKTAVVEARRTPDQVAYWWWSFGKRPADELYRTASDPWCVDDLAGEAIYRPILEQLRTRLFEALEAQGDPRMHGEGQVFDAYPYADERTQGFYERFQRGELRPADAGWVRPSDFEANFPDSLRRPPERQRTER